MIEEVNADLGHAGREGHVHPKNIFLNILVHLAHISDTWLSVSLKYVDDADRYYAQQDNFEGWRKPGAALAL